MFALAGIPVKASRSSLFVAFVVSIAANSFLFMVHSLSGRFYRPLKLWVVVSAHPLTTSAIADVGVAVLCLSMVLHMIVRKIADRLIAYKHITNHAIRHFIVFNLYILSIFCEQKHTIQIRNNGSNTRYNNRSFSMNLKTYCKRTFHNTRTSFISYGSSPLTNVVSAYADCD